MPENDLLLTKQFGSDSKVFNFCFPAGEQSRYIYESIFNLCSWKYLANKVVFEAAKSNIPNGLFVDVGANVGTETVFASEVFNKIVAFEIDPINVTYLQKNITLNHVDCTVVQRPVSDVSGQRIYLKRVSTNIAGSHASYTGTSHDDVPIESITLGDYGFRQPISYLHVDTEGMDAKVLMGAARTIQRQSKAPIVKFEFSPAHLHSFGSSAADFIRFSEVFEYTLYIAAPVQFGVFPIACMQMLFEQWKNSYNAPCFDLYAFPKNINPLEER